MIHATLPAASAVPLTAAQKRPFKTLLGHRLVMNEDGQPMHKSDGTAIWFEEAAEQLGVDTMRWMYLAHNPAQDLRFGTRHKDKPVTIETPDGPTDHTAEGLPVCEVVSKPADEVRRQILIPLWNSYSFFVNYARLDEFDPLAPPVPISLRPEIDRWILSNLQVLIATCRREFENYNTPGACSAAAAFIDDLSNWYIRRNRRRFWRSRDASDTDKLAAYQTLYEVLVTLSKLLAPCAPFVCERMYQNLVIRGLRTHSGRELKIVVMEAMQSAAESKINSGALEAAKWMEAADAWGYRLGLQRQHEQFELDRLCEGHDPDTSFIDLMDLEEDIPPSVHLCWYPKPAGDYPEPVLDPELNERMALAQLVVKLGHKLREEADLRVRQPLAELRFACQDPQQRAAIERLADVIEEELNLKKLTSCDHLDDLVSYVYKPNQKALGPKYGKLLGAITQTLAATDPQTLAPLRRGEGVTLNVGDVAPRLASERDASSQATSNGSVDPNASRGATSPTVVLLPTDIVITTQQAAEWVSTDERGVQIALSTHLTPELLQEGIARDFVRQVQQLRKDANLEIQARIKVCYSTDDADVLAALKSWGEYIRGETLADAVNLNSSVPTDVKAVTIGSAKLPIWIDVK
ncbi:MAG: class I tRNA ligase family protein [Planctomycetaceae bacterium]|nr:class I tRNA ligase family protein [Planctomycetaceae bacterium]